MVQQTNDDEWWMKIIIADRDSENDSTTICFLGKQKNLISKSRSCPTQTGYGYSTNHTILQAVYSCAHLHSAGETFGPLSKAVNV